MIGLLRKRAAGVPPLETERLRLVAITASLLQAEAEDSFHLGKALTAQIPVDWPPEHWEPHVRGHILAQLTSQPETVGWHRHIVLLGKPNLLVGSLGAFPCAAGDVEMGYSVVNSHQRRGIATEAARAHIGWLLTQAAVHSVSAQTYITMPQSIKVMERCGLRFVGPGDEAGTVRYRRWQ